MLIVLKQTGTNKFVDYETKYVNPACKQTNVRFKGALSIKCALLYFFEAIMA